MIHIRGHRFWLRKLLSSLLLILGVTAISFLLLVQFGPDPAVALAGKYANPEQVRALAQDLGHDQPLLHRYLHFLERLLTLDFGPSLLTGEPVAQTVLRSAPVSMLLVTPGFLLGNLVGLLLAYAAARKRGSMMDRAIMGLTTLGMSFSFVVVMIIAQLLLCTPYGLDWFPVRGWSTTDLGDYLWHVTVPTGVLVFMAVGYNARFYRAVLAEQLGSDHVLSQRAFGEGEWSIAWHGVLRPALGPVVTRLLFSVPMLVIGGSLLLENYFGIPGIGKLTFDAMTSGDQAVMLAVIGATAALYATVTVLADWIYPLLDPGIRPR